MAFATAEDLATFLQRDLTAADTATAELLLDVVSGAIRSFTGQQIDAVANEQVTLTAVDRRLFLPELPVTALTSVTLNAVPLVVTQNYTVDLTKGVIRLVSYDPGPYVVTYSHGYAAIPDGIKGVCLEAAAALMVTPAQEGVRSESVGSYSVTYEAARRAISDLEAGRLGRYRDLVVA